LAIPSSEQLDAFCWQYLGITLEEPVYVSVKRAVLYNSRSRYAEPAGCVDPDRRPRLEPIVDSEYGSFKISQRKSIPYSKEQYQSKTTFSLSMAAFSSQPEPVLGAIFVVKAFGNITSHSLKTQNVFWRLSRIHLSDYFCCRGSIAIIRRGQPVCQGWQPTVQSNPGDASLSPFPAVAAPLSLCRSHGAASQHHRLQKESGRNAFS
jgi:hypothetical protein